MLPFPRRWRAVVPAGQAGDWAFGVILPLSGHVPWRLTERSPAAKLLRRRDHRVNGVVSLATARMNRTRWSNGT